MLQELSNGRSHSQNGSFVFFLLPLVWEKGTGKKRVLVINEWRARGTFILPYRPNLCTSPVSSTFHSESTIMSDPNLFKELFTREFSNLINAGVDKQAAAAQALLSAQRSLTHPQQSPSEISNSNGSSSSSSSSVLSASNGNKVIESDTNPTHDDDNNVHRKGKVAEAVNGTTSSTKSASSQVVKLTPLKAIPQVIVPPAVELFVLKKLLSECEASNNFSPLIRFIGSSFASAEALNISFSTSISSSQDLSLTLEGKMDVVADENNDCSSSSCGSLKKGSSGDGMIADCGHDVALDIDIDIAAVSEAFALLFACGHEGVRNSLGHALEGLTYSMQTQQGTQTCTTPNSLKHLLVVLEHPEILDPRLEITCRCVDIVCT